MAGDKSGLQIVICGRGGQGVLFLTRVLDEAALAEGKNVISSETHGMAMRGGSVVSSIRIGSFASPLIRSGQADIMLALSDSEADRTMHLLKKTGGQVYVNSAASRASAIDATGMAHALGSLVVSNLVLLGFACAHKEFPFSLAAVKKVLKRISSPRVLDINLRALTEGYKRVKSSCSSS
jgi:indolepyruvate ferredoxin oxidoreductase beta subunit